MDETTARRRMKEHADALHFRMEEWCAEHDGDMVFFFDSIYGEDEGGNFIVGYGICGSANLCVGRDRVYCGSQESGVFTEELQNGLAELWELLEDC